MDPALMVLSINYASPDESHSRSHKKMKMSSYNDKSPSTSMKQDAKVKTAIVNYSNPFSISSMLDSLSSSGKFGSVTKEIMELIDLKVRLFGPHLSWNPSLLSMFEDAENLSGQDSRSVNLPASHAVIDLEDDLLAVNVSPKSASIIVLSDDEDEGNRKPSYPFPKVRLMQPPAEPFIPKEIKVRDYVEKTVQIEEQGRLPCGTTVEKDRGVYVGVQEDDDNQTKAEDDGMGDIWQQMSIAMEISRDVAEDNSFVEYMREDGDECDHSFVLKDDLGFVCHICGLIGRRIETIIDVQFKKVKRSNRTYISESQSAKDRESRDIGVKLFETDLMMTDIAVHPRHRKLMKPHQVEGFNFLLKNLVADNPGGSILAHAPGSGKTFMIISFVQSFLAKYPQARPLVVLPKGILATWKKEFQKWQVEDIPLLDLYSGKADSRAQQLEVLKKWVEEKSVLFLGYKKFSAIICDTETSKISATCQELLRKQPSIMILDEGHTPRNENTDVLQSLAQVQTPRKVVLSGTLYQNHVKEVFNILKLVRPKFLKLERSRSIIKRIMSRVQISGLRKQIKANTQDTFYELVEHSLQSDANFQRKVNVIKDLREMTSEVLHYYKWDFLEELPGLVDLTVLLNLSSSQKSATQKLKKLSKKMKVAAVGSAIYLHPKLNSLSESGVPADDKMDNLLERLDVKDGVKAKFFLNMLSLCEASDERLLVFSQYLLPLKFLERLAVKMKSWSIGREIFVISGESNADEREWAMEQFNNSPHSKVFLGSIKACGEGISLVGASRIIILDVPYNPSVTRQAVGRAFRPGQEKKVYVYRLVATESPEEEDHEACLKKELISRMWFEWNEYCGYTNFQVETVDVSDCGDPFLMESPHLKEDVRVLYRR